MEQWDDLIKEEKEGKNQEMLNSLQRLYRFPVKFSPILLDEQNHILERIQTRLAKYDSSLLEQNSKKEARQESAKILNILPPSFRKPSQPTRRLRIFNTAIAVLLAVILVGGTWLLFNRVSSPTDTIATGVPVSPSIMPVTVRTQANGVEAVMQITSGPYFLSELLEANLSLTNHTKTVFDLQGVAEMVPCDPALHVEVTKGTKPYYDIPVLNTAMMSCPTGITQLQSGQTIHIRQDIPLVVSGHAVLTLGAKIEHIGKYDQNGKSTSYVFDPLAHHWPSLTISIASKIPSNRVISLQWHGLQVNINAPASARTNLLYYFTCQQFVASGSIEGSTEGGNFTWTPLGKTVLDTSQCPRTNSKWTFAVGASGYTVVNGIFPF